jgi:hypothetical protein
MRVKKEIRSLNIADIHSGESKTNAQHVYNVIKNYLDKECESLTHIFVCGDFTHRQLTASSEDWQWTKKTFLHIVFFCINHNIKLRFLEGTPSHDYRQVETLALSVPDACDFKYFKTIDIEYDEEYGCHILYVPDEMGETSIDVITEVKSKMSELGIAKVNIAIMHGSLEYHMFGKKSYKIEDLDFVTGYVSIGHNHTTSVVGAIITPGSLDRNFFGEESEKGGYVVKLSPFYDTPTIRFKPNKISHRLDTLDFTSVNTEDAILRLTSFIKSYPSKFLRIDITGNSEIDKGVLISTAKECGIHLEVKNKKEPSETTKLALETTIEDKQITRENIVGMLKEELGDGADKYIDLIMEIV